MLLLAATASMTALAVQPPAPKVAVPAPAANLPAPTHGQTRKMDQHSQIVSPDPALIAFLGDYADAADGLDPMGLAEHADVMKDTAKDPHKP